MKTLEDERVIVDGQVWGTVSGNTLRKYVVKSKHLFRKWDAWGMDAAIWDNLAVQGIRNLEVLDKQEKILYTIDLEELETWADCEADWGYGVQYFIPRKYFTKRSLDGNTEV